MILLALAVWLGGNLLLGLVCGVAFVCHRRQESREWREFEQMVMWWR